MRTIFDTTANSELLSRIDLLTPKTSALWGKMSVSQMLAHCAIGAGLATGELRAKRTLIGRSLGPIFKSLATSDKPFKKGSPTLPMLLIKDDRDFEQEKRRLKEVVTALSEGGPAGTGSQAHPFFGTLSQDDWGKLSYKHIDHHLRQFGV